MSPVRTMPATTPPFFGETNAAFPLNRASSESSHNGDCTGMYRLGTRIRHRERGEMSGSGIARKEERTREKQDDEDWNAIAFQSDN